MNKLLAFAAITLLTVGIHQLSQTESVDQRLQFENYTTKYGKIYSPAEKAYRSKVYEDAMKQIQIQNADLSSTAKFGENQFTDLTPEEFAALYLTRNQSNMNLNAELYVPQGPVGASADWSNITKVKDQGNCGSCWAFSAVGAVETLLTLKGVLPSNTWLSEQQLVDCDRGTNNGCNGGFENLGISWAKKNGLTTSDKYPYVGKQQKCQISTGQYKPSGYQVVSASNMYTALSYQPITVAVDASSWQYYKTGVFDKCTLKSLNHAVLATGFQEDGVWIIKNSWGTGWGEKGYIRLPAQGNPCGVQNESYVAYLE
ncbi:unnamed protein product [Paramecium pentaurelia]|uniref:cathepsin L n=1 Tax=Paramecium pentaurelia TaxID=43138 RepID=A0A8S1VAU1_9CILI|nr:unnamed protein product [Paramecium pentaurelia]